MSRLIVMVPNPDTPLIKIGVDPGLNGVLGKRVMSWIAIEGKSVEPATIFAACDDAVPRIASRKNAKAFLNKFRVTETTL